MSAIERRRRFSLTNESKALSRLGLSVPLRVGLPSLVGDYDSAPATYGHA